MNKKGTEQQFSISIYILYLVHMQQLSVVKL